MIDVKKIAHLARLEIGESEIKNYQTQMEEVFQYFEQIAEIDTKGVEPLVTPSEIKLIFREDKKEICQSVEQAMQNAPERMGNLFKVPPVV